MPRRGILIGFSAIVGLLTILGLIVGSLGQGIFGDIGLPDWLTVPEPHITVPADVVFHIFGLPITNSIIAAWITVVFLVVLSFVFTRRMKIVPGRLQAAFEFLLGWLYDLCCSVAGEKDGRRFFPIVTTIFLFVGFNAWLGLIPGYGSITIETHEHAVHLIRSANTDINTPLAIAIVAVFFIQFFGLRTLGRHYMVKFVNMGGFFHGLGQVLRGKIGAGISALVAGVIEAFVGFIELVLQFIPIISFTFRLFGNMTAGEILLLVVAFLIPFIMAVPFYGLELLIGFIQAIIFGGLTLVFLVLAVASHDEAQEH
ncbi:MAG: F0F1 ATP synthase subunit A [Dehalococcoidales bacterium]|nr:MAG: F0F1 ATP synthase subunit A [Dehalococcoidales bacterium]